jgi:hypothetical protein
MKNFKEYLLEASDFFIKPVVPLKVIQARKKGSAVATLYGVVYTYLQHTMGDEWLDFEVKYHIMGGKSHPYDNTRDKQRETVQQIEAFVEKYRPGWGLTLGQGSSIAHVMYTDGWLLYKPQRLYKINPAAADQASVGMIDLL